MKKQVFGRKFGRTSNQRQALFRGLIGSLIEKGEITTTLPRAKAVRSQAEKLVTRAKGGSLTDRRVILRFLPKRTLVNRLVEGIAPLFKEQKGGYLRIIHLGRRKGDAAEMARLAFAADLSLIKEKAKAEKEMKAPKTEGGKTETIQEAEVEKKAPVKKSRKIK